MPLEALRRHIEAGFPGGSLLQRGGCVTAVTPSHCRISGLPRDVPLGETLTIGDDARAVLAEVIAIDRQGALAKLYASNTQVPLGAIAWCRGTLTIRPDASWKGRTIDALGRPIDELGSLQAGQAAQPCDRAPPAPMRREKVIVPQPTGVRGIDLFTPLCRGQRIGIFAGSGVGKSTLLAMLVRASGFDSIVLALVGERGREVREFVEGVLGDARARAITVVATSDESPMMRRLAPRTATTIAESLRDKGENVLLLIDSITRYAHALRDVALAAGEAPVARGFPPSVFSDLPRLLERAGMGDGNRGAITGIYSVLVDGDDHNDPVADHIRGTLDGHIVLSRRIAEQGRFPAIDPLASISRLAPHAQTKEQAAFVTSLRAMIARFEDTRDIRMLGGYAAGTDAALDQAVRLVPRLYTAINQSGADPASQDPYCEVARALDAQSTA